MNWLAAHRYAIALPQERDRTHCPPLWVDGVPYYRPHHVEVLDVLRTIDSFNLVKFYHPEDKDPALLADFLRLASPKWWMGLNRYRGHIMVLAGLDTMRSPHPKRELLEWLLEYFRCS